MKKLVPVFLFLIGIIVVVGAVFFVKSKNKPETQSDTQLDAQVPEVALDKRPVTSLTPTSDGHWLTLHIDKILIDAKTLDYELLYKVADGRTAGVPGTIDLDKELPAQAGTNRAKGIERKLLLGSESSGKFRYDEGVEQGTLTLKFRNTNGKVVAKFMSDFKLLHDTKELKSVDSKFKISLNKVPVKTFFVIMDTFGYPGSSSLDSGTLLYGFFSSSTSKFEGTATIEAASNVSYWDGTNWQSKFSSFGNGIFADTLKN